MKNELDPLTLTAIIGFLLFCIVLSYLAHRSRVIVNNSGNSEKERLIQEIK